MAKKQHEYARKLLPIIFENLQNGKTTTLQKIAEELGLNPRTEHRVISRVCKLIDAAAALAGVPQIALYVIRVKSGEINPKAWTGGDNPPYLRSKIIDACEKHQFTKNDIKFIEDALDTLKLKGDVKAWKFVRDLFPGESYHKRLTGPFGHIFHDAFDDIGSEELIRVHYSGLRYPRNPTIRARVIARSEGRCEFCDQQGFKKEDGSVYLESHHIRHIADEGEDRMTNVIALCPNDHRKAHFSADRKKIEKEMMRIVQDKEDIKL